MQISIETTTQSASILTASFSGSGNNSPLQKETDQPNKPASVNLLEAATKKADEDAVVIAALQEAVEKGKGATDEDGKDKSLATIADYQKTAGKLKTALGAEDSPSANLSYESGTTTTTTIEAEIGGQTISAEFISFERVSYDSATGLSVRSASASSINTEFGGVSASYQNASVSSLYAGGGDQLSALGDYFA